MEKVFIRIERRMGVVMIVLGVTALVLGTVYFKWHLWMFGGMLLSLGREVRRG